MILEYPFLRVQMSSFKERYSKLLEGLPLAKYEKNIIIERYIRIVVSAENNYRRTRIFYILLTNTITIAGVLITGLISIDKMDIIDKYVAEILFWIVWSLSIILTLSNKWLYSFNIHKKYVLNTVVMEKLYSEGWMFASGIGRYSKCADYSMRFKLFCARIEKIKTKSLENMPELEAYDAANDILATGSPSVSVETPIGGVRLRSRRSKLILGKKARGNQNKGNNNDSRTCVVQLTNADDNIADDVDYVTVKIPPPRPAEEEELPEAKDAHSVE